MMITHYTSDVGFKSIIETGRLWFTDIDYLNDYFERQLVSSKIHETYSLMEHNDILSLDVIKKGEEDLFAIEKKSFSASRAFVLSCSDLPDELPMWNYYSKNSPHGGYNISFDSDVLCKSIISNVALTLSNSYLLFGQVFYDNESLEKLLQLWESLVERVLSETVKKHEGHLHIWQELAVLLNNSPELGAGYFKENSSFFECATKALFSDFYLSLSKHIDCFQCNGTSPKVVKYSSDSVKVDAFNLECFFKKHSFSYEQEKRLVINIQNEFIPQLIDKGIYKTRCAHGMIIPYLDIPFDKTSIKEVCIAPTNQTLNIVENTDSFLKLHGVDALVKKSEIPVRY